MTQLTADSPRVYSEETRTDWDDALADAVNLYQGSAASKQTTGYVRQLTASATDQFAGFVEHTCLNVAGTVAQNAAFQGATPGTGVAGGTSVNLRVEGGVILNVTTDGSTLVASVADKGGVVYASDGNTFTYSSAGNNIKVGIINKFLGVVSGTAGQNGCVAQYLVYFQSYDKRNS